MLASFDCTWRVDTGPEMRLYTASGVQLNTASGVQLYTASVCSCTLLPVCSCTPLLACGCTLLLACSDPAGATCKVCRVFLLILKHNIKLTQACIAARCCAMCQETKVYTYSGGLNASYMYISGRGLGRGPEGGSCRRCMQAQHGAPWHTCSQLRVSAEVPYM